LCNCTELKVYPNNWTDKNVSLKKEWYIFYRFYDPAFSYSYEFLSQKAVQIKEWMSNGKDVYAYFNNTAGDAYKNAHTLKKLCGK
jgi:uncharacterized protein YecE (DUF72 family)